MADDSLPKEFDTIILGTGLSESILAAALSRIGRSVLHLDRNAYYGGSESTHSFTDLLTYSSREAADSVAFSDPSALGEGEMGTNLSTKSAAISNLVYDSYTISEEEYEDYRRLIEWETEQTIAAEKAATQKLIEPVIAVEPDSMLKESEADCTSEIPPDNEGSDSANTTTDAKQEIAENEQTPAAANDSVTEESSDSDPTNQRPGISDENPIIKLFVKSASSAADLAEVGVEQKCISFTKNSRRFILDLSPKLLYSRSAIVELLISSDVARYCEFRSVTQILTTKDDKLEAVPCSRSDIFSSKSISMIEKRILMKLLTLCMETEKHQDLLHEWEDKPFIDFLRSQKLTPNLIRYVVHAIAMVSTSATTSAGMSQTKLFLKSVGKYGPTPFLWPLYGGEINQAFCRMSAVFGGVYILHRTLTQIISQDNKLIGAVCNEGVRFTCKWLITNPDYLLGLTNTRRISRAILLTYRSLSTSVQEQAVLLSLPVEQGDPVNVLELGPAACVCPRQPEALRVVHLTMRSVGDSAKDDLEPYVNKLFSKDADDRKPRLMFACYYNMTDFSESAPPNLPSGVHVTPGPDATIDYDSAVIKAKAIFSELCPEEEFLPRIPDPEDIIYCDDAPKVPSSEQPFSNEETDQSRQEVGQGDTGKNKPIVRENVPDDESKDSTTGD